jgi:hypothetical protein
VNSTANINALLCGALLGVAASALAMQEADVTDFGAVPNDGLDDSVAFQAALDFVMADGGGYLFVPAGDYRIDTCLSVRVPNAQVSNGYISLQVRGAGRNATRLTGGDASGMLFFETMINGMNLTLRDFSLVADAPDCGPAISIVNPELGVRTERAAIVERITIGRTAPQNGFSKGIRAMGQWRAIYRDLDVTGSDRREDGNTEVTRIFEDFFYVDDSVRAANEKVHKTGVGSSSSALTASPWRFFTASDPADAETPRFFSPSYVKPGGGYPADGVLYCGNNPGLDAIVSVDFNEFDVYDTLTLSAELSAYDCGGMAVGFGAEPDLAFGEDGSALWIESDGAGTGGTNVDVRLCFRRDGATTVLETLPAHDAPNAANDVVTLVFDRANNTVTGSWDDGSNGSAAFGLYDLGALGFNQRFRRVKFEVLDEQGLNGNFPRINHIRLEGTGAVWPMTRGIDQDGFYGGRVIGCSVQNAHTAYEMVSDGNGEGGQIEDSSADPCRVGVSMGLPGQEPGIHVVGCSFRAENKGISIFNKRLGKIADNRIEPLTSRGDGAFTDIELFNCWAFQVGNNTFEGSAENRIHLRLDGQGSDPLLPTWNVYIKQIDFHGNRMVLPNSEAVQFVGPKIYEAHLGGNTEEDTP